MNQRDQQFVEIEQKFADLKNMGKPIGQKEFKEENPIVEENKDKYNMRNPID